MLFMKVNFLLTRKEKMPMLSEKLLSVLCSYELYIKCVILTSTSKYSTNIRSNCGRLLEYNTRKMISCLPKNVSISSDFRVELKFMVLKLESDVQSLETSEISLNINKENENETISVDMRDQIIDGLSSLKEKFGLISIT